MLLSLHVNALAHCAKCQWSAGVEHTDGGTPRGVVGRGGGGVGHRAPQGRGTPRGVLRGKHLVHSLPS